MMKLSSISDDEAKPEMVRTLSALSLATLIFFEVSGGAYGIEQIVQAGGPLLALVGLLVVPIVWSIPIALMTAELSTNYPVTGGQVVWVGTAFGQFWGFQAGFWSFIGNIFDTAILPVMCIDYLSIMTGNLSPGIRWVCGFVCLVFITLLNVRGVELAGQASIFFSLLVVSPFLLFVAWGAQYLDVSIWGEYDSWAREEFRPFNYESRMATFVTVLLWNTSGYDMAGACAGEVARPGRVYPLALGLAVLLTTIMYLLPVAVGVCVPGVRDYSLWEDGYFTNVAKAIGGTGFAYTMGVVGTVASLGMLNSMLMASAREIYCMADMGVMPKVLGKLHPQYKTPWVAIIVLAAIVATCILVDFDALVQLSTFIDASAFVLEFLAFIVLRWRREHAHYVPSANHASTMRHERLEDVQPLLGGPHADEQLFRIFNVPGGLPGVVAVSLPPLLLCCITFFVCTAWTWLIVAGTMVLGVVIYFLYSWLARVFPSF